MNFDEIDFASENIKDFLSCEIKRIEIEKWCEGERINCDPGQDYILHWIEVSGGDFRYNWNHSQCKKCKKKLYCGWLVKDECNELEL